MTIHFRSVLFASLIAVAGLSCDSGESTDDLPAPGTMKVISISPAPTSSSDDAENQIENGDFSTWWAGAPAPEQYLPPDPAHSRVARDYFAGDANFAAGQIWRKDDMTLGIRQLFHTRVEVEAGATYTLRVKALKKGGRNVSIWVFEFDDQGTPAPVDSPFLKLVPSDNIYKEYSRSFSPKRSGLVVIASRAEGEAEVLWHEWRFTRNG